MADKELIVSTPEELGQVPTRRSFLRLMSVGGTLVLLPGVFASCDDKGDGKGVGPTPTDPVVLRLNTDIGIFNYAYALEQLEAAFYTEVVNRFGTLGINAQIERQIFTEIRNHEVIHREFFKAALGSAAIPALSVNFGSALNSRASVLSTAITFEDLGVSAYNGAGKYLKDPRNLLVAGKIVSVEGRHAAVVRDIDDSSGTRFASTADQNGLDVVAEPGAVLAAADPFITTPVTIGAQPTP